MMALHRLREEEEEEEEMYQIPDWPRYMEAALRPYSTITYPNGPILHDYDG